MATSDYISPYSGAQVDDSIEGIIDGLYNVYSFDTVAKMLIGETSNGLVVNMLGLVGRTVETLGYRSSGDGGGSVGQVKDGTHTQDGGSVITISGDVYFYAYPYHNREYAYDLRQFGVYGDNVNSDDDQIQAAFNTALPISGTRLHCALTDSNRLYQYAPFYPTECIFDLSSTGNHNYQPVIFASAAVKSTQFVGDVAKDSTFIPYTQPCEIGDMVVISNDENCFSANPAEGIKRGEEFIIISIPTGQIELHNSVWLDLDGATATVYEKLTVGVIGSLQLIGNGFDITNIGGNETGLRYEHCINNVIEGGYSTIDIDHHGIHTDSCFNSRITGFDIVQDQPEDPQAVQDAAQVIYGIAMFNCETESQIFSGRVNGGKHPINWTQNNTSPGYSKNVHIYDNTLTACWHSAIGTHDAQTLGVADDNIMEDCARGVEFRSPDMIARNNSIKVSRLRGISLGEGINLTEDCSGAIIDGNDVDAKTFCIRCDTAALEMTGVEFTNNKLNDLNGASSGFRIDTVLNNSNFSGNRAMGTAFSTGTLIDINETMIGGVVELNSSTGTVVNGLGNKTKISRNHRDGTGFCVTWNSEVNEDCMAVDNTSISGSPVNYVGGYHKNNYSTTTPLTTIRNVQPANYNAIDIFDTDVVITNSDTFTTLDRAFTQIQETLFSLSVTNGPLTVQTTTDALGVDNGIISALGGDIVLAVGEAMLLQKVYNTTLDETRYWVK